jgi:oxygen-independent coproporphyrinogen-3 oxidase
MSSPAFSLYLHFPYCSHRCPYCDFNVHVRKQIPEKEFVEALLQEANFRASLPEWIDRKLSTIFLGGGTPTLFSAEALSELLAKLRLIWEFESDIEISIEANPDTISEPKLFELRSAGINRVSIGVQSFSNEFLKVLGRNHSGTQARESIIAAQAAGFENINI